MKYLNKLELTAMLTAAKASSQRDHMMILVAYSHGLRASEVCALTSDDIKDGFITVARLKGSMRTTQPLVRSSDPLFDESPLEQMTGRLFPVTRKTFQRIVTRAGMKGGVPKHLCHPHAAKHTCAKLALKGGIAIDELKQYLGHRSLSSTGAYLASDDATASAAFAAAVGK